MRRFVVGAVAALLLGGKVQAQTTYSTYTFTAVDGVRLDTSGYLLVTGVLEGASAAAEERIARASLSLDLAECRRYAIIAMSKPSQYRLSFDAIRVTPTTGTPYLSVRDCKLQRAVP